MQRNPSPRTVVVLDDAVQPAAAAPGVELVTPDVRRLADAYAVEALADGLAIELFAVLAVRSRATLGAATAYSLPHRVAALGLLEPAPLAADAGFDVTAITAPTVIWSASPDATTRWWAAAVSGARLEVGVSGGLADVVADLLHVADHGPSRP